MKSFFVAVCWVLVSFLMISCQESIDDRAAREAKEYTEKYCPTPVENGTITDSIVFYKDTRTYATYITFVGDIDNARLIKKNESILTSQMLLNVRLDTRIKMFKDAEFNFDYIIRSQKNQGKVILKMHFTPEQYN